MSCSHWLIQIKQSNNKARYGNSAVTTHEVARLRTAMDRRVSSKQTYTKEVHFGI
jgi:hypothetical protein